jgi:hypothetical protein
LQWIGPDFISLAIPWLLTKCPGSRQKSPG